MKTTYSFMRRSFAALLVTMGFMLTGNSLKAQSNSDIAPEIRTEITALNHVIEKSVLSKDFSSIIDLYTDDATIMVPGGQKIQGRKAIADYWYKMSDAKSIKSEIIEMGGNSKMIYQIGKWTVTKIENGSEKTLTTDVVLVWKRGSDYSYKIQLNSSNNPVATLLPAKGVYEAEKP